jgi:2-polyprenyl-3-methyl-5-hydroxy-6-metoxy-1,4-benzoquinol methylase
MSSKAADRSTGGTEASPSGASGSGASTTTASASARPRPSLYHRLLRAFMRSIGQLSDGIRLGYRVGFDSGTMVDYVYRNKAHGITPLGTLIDRIMLDHKVWKAVRARRRMLIEQARALLAEDPKAAVFDVAAGPGSYLFELPRAEIWAGDFSPDEVRRGTERAKAGGRDDIRFVQADAFDPSTWPKKRFEILIASGFFDILEKDADVRRLIEAGTKGTGPGARWVLTVMEGHPDLLMLRDVLVNFDLQSWTAVTRSAEEVLAIAEPFGWRRRRIDREASGQYGVVTMVRS